MVIFRLTYGWNRKEAEISFGEFSKMTGIKRRHCVRGLKSLREEILLVFTDQGTLTRQYTDFKRIMKSGGCSQVGE